MAYFQDIFSNPTQATTNAAIHTLNHINAGQQVMSLQSSVSTPSLTRQNFTPSSRTCEATPPLGLTVSMQPSINPPSLGLLTILKVSSLVLAN
jgi:hypothetical protein